MKREHKGLIVFVLAALAILSLYKFGMLPSLQEVIVERDTFRDFAMKAPILAGAIFFLSYILVIAFSVPLATPMSLLAGYLFGALIGTVLVVGAATIGATIIFALARYFFREAFLRAFRARVQGMEDEFDSHGFRDLLLLRLTPLIPFSFINIGAALSSVSLLDYILATFIGIIPFAYVYVAGGVELGRISSLSDIVTLDMLWQRSFIALVAFALLYFGARRKKKIPTEQHLL